MAFQRLSGGEEYDLSTYRPVQRRPVPSHNLSASLESPFSPYIPLKGDKDPSTHSISDYEDPSDRYEPSRSTSGFFSRSRKYERTRDLEDHNSTAYNNVPPNRPQIGQLWQPGFWRQFPWLGMAAMLGTVLFTCIAMVVLVISNGKPIDQWNSTLQPTVYISISTALANITLTYALYDGMVISFWRKIGRGATLQELHQYWHSGASLWGALMGVTFRRGKITSLACIMTIVSILRGPVLQRASSVKNVVAYDNGTMTVHAAEILPAGFTGIDSGRTSIPSYMNPNFTTIFQDYKDRRAITAAHSGCESTSTCKTSIKAFGFGVECNITHIPYSLEPRNESTGYDLPTIQAFNTFASSVPVYHHGSAQELYIGNADQLPEGPNTGLLLNSTFMQNATSSYNGSLASHTCALRGGIVSYPILIRNNTITLQNASWRSDTFLEDRGLEELQSSSASNLAGFILAANNLYQSNASFQFGGGVGWILNFDGFMPNQYLRKPTTDYNFYYLDTNISFSDPMDDMINGLREVAFRTALQVAADNLTFPNSVHNVAYTGTKPETIYTTNFRYMAAGVIVSLLGVVAVAPTFRGWWELGRRVSLSPLEVAKAFDAPLLRDLQGNVPASDMLRQAGPTLVRYGDYVMVSSPGGRWYRRSNDTDGNVRKLTIGETGSVKPPERGVRYI